MWDFNFISSQDRQIDSLLDYDIVLDADTSAIRRQWKEVFEIQNHFRAWMLRGSRLKVNEATYVILFDWTVDEKDGAIQKPHNIDEAFLGIFRTIATSYSHCQRFLFVAPDYRSVLPEYGHFARDVILRRINDPYRQEKASEHKKAITIYGFPETWPIHELF